MAQVSPREGLAIGQGKANHEGISGREDGDASVDVVSAPRCDKVCADFASNLCLMGLSTLAENGETLQPVLVRAGQSILSAIT